VLAQTVDERQANGRPRTVIEILESDPGDLLGRALARLGRALQSRNSE
jgi:hypothetical protein